jgi:LysM repeat protein
VDYGIDVSRWNNVTNWGLVKRNGISFASVKLTQGDYLVSPTAVKQVDGARKAGVAVGGYHFADGNVPVARNVAQFVKAGTQRGVFAKGSLAPMLDLENSPPDNIYWNATTANAFVAAFIRQLRNATGVSQVLVYASLSMFNDMLRPSEWADNNVFLWIALYNGDPGNVRGYSNKRSAVHQHTSTGYVPGVAGNVDRNVTLGAFTAQSLTIGNVAPSKPTPAPTPAPAPAPTPGGWVDYTVRSGDTLSAIASARGTTADELARVNRIANPSLIYAGQVIRVPASKTTTMRHYRVQAGDTLAEIAAKFTTTVAAIAAVNKIANPDLIYAGQWLDIPAAGRTPTPVPRRTYTVKSGDNLTSIAKRLGVTVDHLVKTNKIANPNLIQAGRELHY